MAEILIVDSGWITASKNHHKFRLYAWETGTDVSTNKSTFRFEFYLTPAKTGYDWVYNSTVPVTYSISIGGYSWSGKIMKYDGTSTVKISSGGGYTVAHNSDGNKTISASFSVSSISASYLPGSASFSKTGVPMSFIPRQASITAAPDFNDMDNPTIEYSNPAGTAVTTLQACISFDGSKDDIAYRDIDKSGTSYTFNLTNAEREVLRKATTSSETRVIKFYIKTIIGDTTLYSNVDKTLTIIDSVPDFSSGHLSYKDTNEAVTAITGTTPPVIVQNQSNLKVTYEAATAKKHATITQYAFTLNGVTKTSTAAGGTVDFGKINSDKDLTLSVTVTDSRGNYVKASKTIKCYKYYNPSFTRFKAYRSNDDGSANLSGTWITCEYATNIASVGGTNTRTISIKGIGSDPILASGDRKIINLNGDDKTTYKVYAVVTDAFGKSKTSEVVVIRGDTRIINISPSGTGIALGKKSEIDECLDSEYEIRSSGNIIARNNKTGFYIAKNNGAEEVAIYRNYSNEKNNLWIGAAGTNDRNITGGGTYISTGDNTHLYVGKPVDGTRNTFKVLDENNYTDWALSKADAAYKPIQLFSNTNGTGGTVTWSGYNASDFKFIEIFYKDNNGDGLKSTRVYSPNGKKVEIACIESSATSQTIYIRATRWIVSDTALTYDTGRVAHMKGSTLSVTDISAAQNAAATTNRIKITGVFGYK